MSIRIPVTLVIDMDDAQVENYADDNGLDRDVGGKVRAKTMVDDVRSYVLTAVQDSAAFGEIGLGDGTRGATVTLK